MHHIHTARIQLSIDNLPVFLPSPPSSPRAVLVLSRAGAAQLSCAYLCLFSSALVHPYDCISIHGFEVCFRNSTGTSLDKVVP